MDMIEYATYKTIKLKHIALMYTLHIKKPMSRGTSKGCQLFEGTYA